MKMTAEQTRAVESRAPLICVNAAAGSGKTRILVERIVHLLEHDGARLDEIVAFTFMEKAAAEMKSRLRARFRERALDPAASPGTANRWRALARDVDAARVSTIHGFCMSVLRENALRLGEDPDAAMLDEGGADLAAQQAVTETLHAMLREEDPHALRLVVEQGTTRVAAALREVLRRRAAFQDLCETLPMDDPAALLDAWRDRCAAEFDRRLTGLRHSWRLNALLRRLRALDGRCPDDDPDPRARRRLAARDAFAAILGGGLDASQTHALLKGVLVVEGRADRRLWSDPEAFDAAEAVEKDVKKCVGDALAPFAAANPETDGDAAQLAVSFAAVARRVLETYDAAKRAMNAMDFDDLIERTRAALRDNGELRARVAEGIRFLLVDEFQDTDRVQYGIAELLAGCGNGPALFAVGDPKQSIYLFRGADVGLFTEVHARAGENALPLPKNFRSLPDVLGFINTLFKEAGVLAAVEDYRGIGTHRGAVGDLPRIEVFVGPAGENGKAVKVEDQAQAEADYLARRIRAMVGSGEALRVDDNGAPRPVGYGDIAVLFRKTTHTHFYEEALRAAGIPYCRAAGEGFYERQEIMDVLHLLKTVTDPWNEPALLAFLRGPAVCLNDDEIVRLRMAGGVARTFNAGDVPARFPRPEKLVAARRLITDLRGLSELPCGAFLRRMLDMTRFEPVLLGQYQGLQKASNLRKLTAAADNFARRGTAGLRGFVQYLDDLRSGAAREGDANLQAEGGDAVVLLTVHKAKGLEFPVVFLAGMGAEAGRAKGRALYLHGALGMALNPENEEGDKEPCGMARAIADRTAREEEAEEARTLYVALTRARDYLALMGPSNPRAASWFGVVDRVFGVAGMNDGAAFQGTTWRGVVRCHPPKEIPGRTAAAPDAEVDIDRLRARIAPVPPAGAPERKIFPVTEVLNQLFGDGGAEEQGGTDAAMLRAVPEEDRERRCFAMARGTLAHRLFEEWDLAAGTPPGIVALVREARLGLAHRERLRGQLEKMAERFRGSDLEKRLAADTALRREEPFLLTLDGAVIRGTIDALLGDGTVLDYKTGSRDEKKAERHAFQLALYAAAARRLLGVECREGLLYYADLGEVVPVPTDTAAVEKALSRAAAAIAILRGR